MIDKETLILTAVSLYFIQTPFTAKHPPHLYLNHPSIVSSLIRLSAMLGVIKSPPKPPMRPSTPSSFSVELYFDVGQMWVSQSLPSQSGPASLIGPPVECLSVSTYYKLPSSFGSFGSFGG